MRIEKNPDGLHTKCKQIKIKILKEKQRKTKRDWQGKRNRSYFLKIKHIYLYKTKIFAMTRDTINQ